MSKLPKSWWVAEIQKLKTPAQCRAFAKEVADRADLVIECKVQEARVTPLRKGVPEPVTSVEQRIYNDMRTLESLGSTRFSRSWPMIARYGYVATVERLLKEYRREDRVRTSSGFRIALKYDRLDCTYEQVALDYPKLFSEEVRAVARRTLAHARKVGYAQILKEVRQ
jgi:hypothetical protein